MRTQQCAAKKGILFFYFLMYLLVCQNQINQSITFTSIAEKTLQFDLVKVTGQ